MICSVDGPLGSPKVSRARSGSGSMKEKEELSEELSRRLDAAVDHNTALVLACKRRLAELKTLPDALALSRTIRDARHVCAVFHHI